MPTDLIRRDPVTTKQAANQAMAASALAQLPPSWHERTDLRIPVVCECPSFRCWRLHTAPLSLFLPASDRPALCRPECVDSGRVVTAASSLPVAGFPP